MQNESEKPERKKLMKHYWNKGEKMQRQRKSRLKNPELARQNEAAKEAGSVSRE